MSALGRNCSDRKSCITRVVLCFCVPLFFTLLIFLLGLLANVSTLFLLIVWDSGTVACSSHSLENAEWRTWPFLWIHDREVTITGSITVCVSSVKSSSLIERKGLSSCSTTLVNDFTSLQNWICMLWFSSCMMCNRIMMAGCRLLQTLQLSVHNLVQPT